MTTPRLRAPQRDRAVVAEPPLDRAGHVLEDNRQGLARLPGAVLGRSWGDLRRQARREAVAAACDYLRESGVPKPDAADVSLLLAGHQPELFHPGVWVKNFALHRLARLHGATPLNLVVDTDTVKTTALRLPALTPRPHVCVLAFDRWEGETPYEERWIHDVPFFTSFAGRAREITRDWGFEPLLPAYWDEVQRQAGRTPLLGECFAAARRELERRWGCHNLELPVSRLCRTGAFAWFACHLLDELPRFHQLYNECVRAFRRRHGLRSRNHPVPDLTAESGWLELPLWAWCVGQTRRRRLLARPGTDSIELRAEETTWPSLPRGPRLVPAWQALEHQGLKVRSRALTNTLYARLFLGDVFLHGIGGGTYDELTDDLIRRFYGVEPPGFLVLSATLLLPLPTFPVTEEQCRRLRQELRDLHHNPQRHLPPQALTDPGVSALLAERAAWVARTPADAEGRRQRFAALRELTEQLRPYVAEQETAAAEAARRCAEELQANGVLQRRDYAFCLYPEALLRTFCEQFL